MGSSGGADDVCVRCRVRRSITASKVDFGCVVEMTCIMRHWSSESTPMERANSTGSWVNSLHSSTNSTKGDSELILKVIASNNSDSSFFPSSTSSPTSSKRYRSPSPLYLQRSRDSEELKIDTRSISPGPTKMNTRRRSQSRSGSRRRGMLPPTTAAAVAAFQVGNTTTNNKGLEEETENVHQYNIPLTDIVRASLESTPKDDNTTVNGFLLYLISNNHGMLELSFHSINSRDIVYAFLNANIPEAKLSSIRGDDNSNNNTGLLEKKSSVDMEDFQANKVKDRFMNETIKQKMSRKMSLLACRISEAAVSFTDCCLCGSDLDQVGQEPSVRKTQGLELYDSKKTSSLSDSSNNKTKNNRFQTPQKVALHQLPTSTVLKQSIAANRPPKPINDTPVLVVRSFSDTNFPDIVKVPTSKSTLDFEMATTGSLELSTGNEENNINHTNINNNNNNKNIE